jgi:transglutaminase-like putative cysteine protease
MEAYLKASEVINWQHSKIMERAKQITNGLDTPLAIAKACFEWVRDEICRSYDYPQ